MKLAFNHIKQLACVHAHSVNPSEVHMWVLGGHSRTVNDWDPLTQLITHLSTFWETTRQRLRILYLCCARLVSVWWAGRGRRPERRLESHGVSCVRHTQGDHGWEDQSQDGFCVLPNTVRATHKTYQ